ncbi:MAG: hypothetical protein ACPGIC_03890 [Opitutales bacterium]
MLSQRKKRKINPMLMNVILVSAGLHVAALVVLGGITIVKYVIPDDAQFEEPPAIEEEQPPPEVKVEIQQKPPQLNQSLKNLKMKQVGNIAISDVNVDLPDMDQSFTVSAGLGNFGGGSLLGSTRGSLGIGMSNVSVFGLKTKAERILFIIDADRRMLTDKKGGLNSYNVIKDEITNMVGNLSAGTLFNVIMRDGRRIQKFKPDLVSAGAAVHQDLVKWITPINTDPNNPGLYVQGIKNVENPKLTAMPDDEIQKHLQFSNYSANLNGFITQLALEQNTDAIFFITGSHQGFQQLTAPASEKQKKDFEKYKASSKYQDQLAQHKIDAKKMWERVRKELARTNAQRAKNGQPPRVLAKPNNLYVCVHELGIPWQGVRHPGYGPGYQYIEPRKVVSYFREVVKKLYLDGNKTPPSINVVLFLAGDEKFTPESQKQLNQYTRFFKGKNRIIRGLDEIKNARSASETVN